PTGTARREKRTIIQQSIPTDPTYKPWREEAMKRGFVTSAAVPLIFSDVCLGALNLYSDQTNFFSEDRLRIFQDFALHTAAVLHEQKIKEEQEKAFVDLKNAIPHPLFIIQDDQVIEINEEFEKDYQITQEQLKIQKISFETIFLDEGISKVKTIMRELENKGNLRQKRILTSVKWKEKVILRSLQILKSVKNEDTCFICILRDPDHI
ncbi:MAG: GAF domain-containing protein, partial [Promethearchaeota archaeon]